MTKNPIEIISIVLFLALLGYALLSSNVVEFVALGNLFEAAAIGIAAFGVITIFFAITNTISNYR